jgi:hypothetical protein
MGMLSRNAAFQATHGLFDSEGTFGTHSSEN